MDYTHLFKSETSSKIGIIGATKGYGYTLLAQIVHSRNIQLRVICSRHSDECLSVLTELGYDASDIVVCSTEEEVLAAPKDVILIVTDYRLVTRCGITSLVECTGNVEISALATMDALNKGINVYMVSKETDSVFGPLFNQTAHENNCIYSLVNGDQPRNLIDLYSWAKALGLEIICAGKSSEYDFIWDPETEHFSYLDETIDLPGMKEFWRYNGVDTLNGRHALLEKYTSPISADMCEMNLVSNVTGFTPAAPRLNYPIARISELADIFIPEADGGILKSSSVVDVFFNLRTPDEASFSGGEFVIIKCGNKKVWSLLKEKGHIISRNGNYACIYYPYHLMGVETPLSILLGDILGIGTHPECRMVSILSGIAEEDMPRGTVLSVHGHHHEIDGLTPELLTNTDAHSGIAPFYLLNGATLKTDIKKGSPIMMENIIPAALHLMSLYERSRNAGR